MPYLKYSIKKYYHIFYSRFAFLLLVFLFSFLSSFAILSKLTDKQPIVADGFENLSIAKNIICHLTFSRSVTEYPIPDMFREPIFPLLNAFLIYFTDINKYSLYDLANHYSLFFKYINIYIYSLSIALGALFICIRAPGPFYWLLFLLTSLLIYGSSPRLVNKINNESLATFFVLLSSILFYENIKGFLMHSKQGGPLVLGFLLGILALTKAQFLYISLSVFVAYLCNNKTKAMFVIAAMSITIMPWLIRNFILFSDPAISERGKIVCAVRIIQTSSLSTHEFPGMAFAFCHPSIRRPLGLLLGISERVFPRLEGKRRGF